MGRYEEIAEARQLFGIGESETMGEVKRKINVLLRQCHPDTGEGRDERRKEKTIALLKAKGIILDYCDGYKISFNENEVNRYLPPGEKWMKSFGDDHIWGGGTGK